MDTFEALKNEALEALKTCSSVSQLQEVKTQYLGPKSQLVSCLKNLKTLSPEEKVSVGRRVNELKSSLEQEIAKKTNNYTPRKS